MHFHYFLVNNTMDVADFCTAHFPISLVLVNMNKENVVVRLKFIPCGSLRDTFQTLRFAPSMALNTLSRIFWDGLLHMSHRITRHGGWIGLINAMA